MVPPDDVDWAVAELERLARMDVRTVFIYTDVKPHMPPYRDPYYDRLWAAAADLDMPVTIHIVAGRVRDPFTIIHDHERGDVARLWLELFSDAGPILANEFIFGGIFDRHPRLKLILGEYEICWLPWFLFRTQQLQGAVARTRSRSRRPRSRCRSTCTPRSGTPSSTTSSPTAPSISRAPTQVMWGSDFPHPRNTFPHSHEVLNRGARQRRRRDQGERGGAQLRPAFFNLDIPAPARAAAE